MKQLFDREGLAALEAFCHARTIFAFDYDGTLAPIVDNPDEAGMRAETKRLLSELLSWVPVAVISGRRRQDLLKFLPPGVDYLIGNHGLEGISGGLASLDAAAEQCRLWSRHLSAQVESIPGVVLENKVYSLTLHYRQASEKEGLSERLIQAAEKLTPQPRLVLGKDVINLLAEGTPHKGSALLELIDRSGSQAAVFCGDDDNDEDAFRLHDDSHLSIRVGECSHSAALYCVPSQAAIDTMLEYCLGFLARSGRLKRDVMAPLTHDISQQ